MTGLEVVNEEGKPVAHTRFRSSWRVQLVGWNILLVLVSAVASLIVLRTILHYELSQDIDADLQQEIDELEALLRANDPLTGKPFDDDAERIFKVFLEQNFPGEFESYETFVDGKPFERRSNPDVADLKRLVPEAVERWTKVTSTDRGSLESRKGTIDYLAVRLENADPEAVFVVASESAQRRQDTQRAATLAVVTEISIGLFIASILGWVLTRRMVRPVVDFTESVNQISAGDLERRAHVHSDDELGRLATTVNHMLDRLEDAFNSQRTFLADAGHELRTPITVMRGHLELISDDPGERAETIELVTSELDRMARLVQDLLTLARAERHDFLNIEAVDLDLLSSEIFDKARALGDRRWVIDSVAVGIADLDPDRLTQSALALAENAVWHTESDSEIGLGTALGDDHLRLWVRDQGSGIPSEEHREIFTRFHRGEGARNRPGSGLGLAIVAGIAEAHGGTVSVDSVVGEGSRFTMRIPVTSKVMMGMEAKADEARSNR